MLSVSPVKLLIVFAVAMTLLGPDKIPHASRKVAQTWRSFRELRERMESQIRETIPDLPSTTDIARMARSPVEILNRLADVPSASPSATPTHPAAPVPSTTADQAPPQVPPVSPVNRETARREPGHQTGADAMPSTGDPGMN